MEGDVWFEEPPSEICGHCKESTEERKNLVERLWFFCNFYLQLRLLQLNDVHRLERRASFETLMGRFLDAV